jgi:hypothetical protein
MMTLRGNAALKAFLSLPTLGGWLAMLHAVSYLLAPMTMMSWPPYHRITEAWSWLSCIWLLPFKAPFFRRHIFWPEEIPAFIVAAAMDSLVWGYGLAARWRIVARRGKETFRFSVRSLLAVTTMVAVGLAAASYVKH